MLSGAYSLVEINNILSVAQNLLDCDENQLLKLSHDADIAAVFDDLMRAKLCLPTTDILELTKAVTTTLEELERDRKPFNRNHLLCYLFTHYVQKGSLINTDSLSMISAWHILHAGLKELKSSQVFTQEAAEGLLLGFIGQCVKMQHHDVASALHNYLFMARKIALSKKCGMGIAYTAKVIGSPLLEGLRLIQRLSPNDLPQEFVFMAKITEALLQLSMFDQPFEACFYAQWGLPKGPFYSIQANVLGPLGDYNAISPVQLYPFEIVKAQTQLAVILKLSCEKKSPQPKQERVSETFFRMEDEIDELNASMSSFSLVPSETLLSQFSTKSKSKRIAFNDEDEQVTEVKEKSKTPKSSSSSSGSGKK